MVVLCTPRTTCTILQELEKNWVLLLISSHHREGLWPDGAFRNLRDRDSVSGLSSPQFISFGVSKFQLGVYGRGVIGAMKSKVRMMWAGKDMTAEKRQMRREMIRLSYQLHPHYFVLTKKYKAGKKKSFTSGTERGSNHFGCFCTKQAIRSSCQVKWQQCMSHVSPLFADLLCCFIKLPKKNTYRAFKILWFCYRGNNPLWLLF